MNLKERGNDPPDQWPIRDSQTDYAVHYYLDFLIRKLSSGIATSRSDGLARAARGKQDSNKAHRR